jgi:general secretion pathway protein J
VLVNSPTGWDQLCGILRRIVLTENCYLDDAGFSLLELLIALTLLVALCSVLYSGLRFGTRAWERSETIASATEELVVAQSFLQHALAGSYPLLTVSNVAQPKVDFEGTSDGMRFLAPAPAALSAGGMSRFGLIATRHDNQNLLVMTSRFELTWEEASSSATDVTLLRGFERVQFGYFGSERSMDPPTWRDSWTEHARLPELVSIQVQFPAGDRREWPELVVAPRLTVDANCLYDPVIRRCRGQ